MTASRDNGEPSVLANLPRSRPQRPSARRAAARQAAAGPAEQVAKAHAKRTPSRTAATPPAPRQGYETEDTIEPGVTVQPPSGIELAASVVELVGELARAVLETGERLLKDAVERFPGL